MNKIAIIGSRSFQNYRYLKESLSDTHIDHIYSGGAVGADSLGERYATEYGIPITVIKPDYKSHGKAATHIRNREIVNSSDTVIAFWNGEPGGTKSVIAYAEKTGKDVIVYYDPEMKYFSRKTILGEPQSPERVKEMYSTIDSSSNGGKKLKVLKQQIIEANQPELFKSYVEDHFDPAKFQHLEGKDNVFIAIPSTTNKNRFPKELCKKLQKTYGGISYYKEHAIPINEEQSKNLNGLQKVTDSRKYEILSENINRIDLSGKNIVLVDDVVTTGASIDGMRQTLYKRGIKVNSIITLCQSELRLATERDFTRIAEKAADVCPSNTMTGKEKVHDIRNKLEQCFEGCLKHKLNYLERDITGNTSIRIQNREELYGVLTGEIKRITRDGKDLLPILLQKWSETRLDRKTVERAANISDEKIIPRGSGARQRMGKYDSGEERRAVRGVEDVREKSSSRSQEAGEGRERGNIDTLKELGNVNYNFHADVINYQLHNNILPKAVENGLRFADNHIKLMENSLKVHNITLNQLTGFIDKVIEKSNDNKMQWMWNDIDNPLMGEDLAKFNKELSAEGNQEYAAEHMGDLAVEYRDEKGNTFATITFNDDKNKYEMMIHDTNHQNYSHKNKNQLIAYAEALYTHKLVREVNNENCITVDRNVQRTQSPRKREVEMDLSM